MFIFFSKAITQPKQLELAQNEKKYTNVEDVLNPKRLQKSNIGSKVTAVFSWSGRFILAVEFHREDLLPTGLPCLDELKLV